jgi:hypothetical protein
MSETTNTPYQHNTNDYTGTLTPPQSSTKYNNKRVNTDTPHQHKYDNKHTDTTHPSTKYYNEWASTSAGYPTNRPPPARTQHPHEQVKRRTRRPLAHP